MDQWQVPSDMASGEQLDRELTKLITVIKGIWAWWISELNSVMPAGVRIDIKKIMLNMKLKPY